MCEFSNNAIKVISSPEINKPYVLIYKPSGIPSAPLCENDEYNALAMAIKLFPEIKNVKGKKEIEYGLLHRIDNATSGLILIATTQAFYDYMQEQQSRNLFIKNYSAICELNPENGKQLGAFGESSVNVKKITVGDEFTISSYFRYFGEKNKEVRPVTENSGKAALNKIGKKVEYTTKIKIVNIIDNTVCVECEISRGFKHQVRNHLAWIGLPIINDELYNYEFRKKIEADKKNAENQLGFSATKLKFYYPEGDLNSYEITPTST